MDTSELDVVVVADDVDIDLEVLPPVAPSGRPGRVTAVADEFDELYQREYEAMVRVSFLLVRDPDLAVEATHDAFARVLERWSKLDHPGAYLRTAVINASRALRRRTFRRSRRHVAGNIDTETAANDLYLADALAALSAERRAAIVLRYYLDLSESEISVALGVRPGTVKSLLHRGLSELRLALADPQIDHTIHIDPNHGSTQ